MSFAQRLANKIKENISVGLELRKERILICDQCPELREKSRTCKQCGCFVDAKTALKSEKCPIGKW